MATIISVRELTRHDLEQARRQRDLELLKSLSERHGVSMVEISRFLRAALIDEFDSIEPMGEPFIFQKERMGAPFCGDLNWINEEVPAPDALVDLLTAWKEAREDAERILCILNANPAFEDLLRVRKNQLAWLKFWAARFPDPELRLLFQKQAELYEAEDKLIAKRRLNR